MKLSAVLLMSILFLSSSSLIQAEETLQNNREKIRDLRQETKTEIKELRQDTKTKIQETRQELKTETAALLAERTQLRFANYTKRFENLLKRLETRIETFKNEGEDVSVAQGKLDGAKAYLLSAQAKGEQAVDAYKAVSSAEDKQAQLVLARDFARQAREDFKNALKFIRQTLEALRALR